MTKFFNKLPTINYNGSTAKNFLARAKISDESLKDKTLMYPYTMDESDRVDMISHKYYDDSDYTWMILLTNNVVDPYYGLYIKEDDFLSFIKDKYGSIANAQTQVAFYRNNWVIDETQLSQAAFDALASNLKKYFTPITDINNSVYGYVRKKEDWRVNTNKIVSLTVSNTVGSFVVGERAQQKYSNGMITANAFVTFSNSSVLTVQHVDGAFIASNTLVSTTITGLSSNSTANAQSSVIVVTNIPTTEFAYWTPVTQFDNESELNTQRKEIMLIDNRYKGAVENQFKKIMST